MTPDDIVVIKAIGLWCVIGLGAFVLLGFSGVTWAMRLESFLKFWLVTTVIGLFLLILAI